MEIERLQFFYFVCKRGLLISIPINKSNQVSIAFRKNIIVCMVGIRLSEHRHGSFHNFNFVYFLTDRKAPSNPYIFEGAF